MPCVRLTYVSEVKAHDIRENTPHAEKGSGAGVIRRRSVVPLPHDLGSVGRAYVWLRLGLLDRDRLGEVPRLVHVGAAAGANVVGEQL